mgnify:CR=1 FL=1
MPLCRPVALHNLLIGDQKAHSILDVKFIKRLATPNVDSAAFVRLNAARAKAKFPAASHLHTLRDLKSRSSLSSTDRDAKIESLQRDLSLSVSGPSAPSETDTASSHSGDTPDEPSLENAPPAEQGRGRTVYVRRRHSSEAVQAYAPPTRVLQPAVPLSRPASSSSTVVRMRNLCNSMRPNSSNEMQAAMRNCAYVPQRSVLNVR